MSETGMTALTRTYTDGSVEVVISTPYGEEVVSVRVSDRRGNNERFAEHEVEFSQRDVAHLDFPHTCMIGSKFLVSVPLSTGEKELYAAEART